MDLQDIPKRESPQHHPLKALAIDIDLDVLQPRYLDGLRQSII